MEIQFASVDSSPDDNDDFTDAELVTGTVANTSGELTCQVCGIDISHLYSGRGRKPRYCEEHKKQAPKASGTTAARGSNIDGLIVQIAEMYNLAGVGLTMVPPTVKDGQIIASNAMKLAESWRPLILRDANVRKFWERMTTGGGWGTVLFAHAGVAMAIMMAHGTLPAFFNAHTLGADNG